MRAEVLGGGALTTRTWRGDLQPVGGELSSLGHSVAAGSKRHTKKIFSRHGF